MNDTYQKDYNFQFYVAGQKCSTEYFSSETQQCNQIPTYHRKMVSLVQKRHIGCIHHGPHISQRDPTRVFTLLSLSLSLQAVHGLSIHILEGVSHGCTVRMPLQMHLAGNADIGTLPYQ